MEATSQILATLVGDIERVVGERVSDVVLTTPANTRDDARNDLLKAAQQCNLNVVVLVAEPTAAALAYIADKQPTNGTIIVYDLGGGTFDVSVLQVEGNEINVLATEGIRKLGGNDVSAIIRKRILAAVEQQVGRQASRDKDALFFGELETKIEAAKRSLNKQPSVPVIVALDGQQIVVEIDQTSYLNEVRQLLKPSLVAMDKAGKAAKVAYSDVQRLVVVGGTSRMPVVQEMVADHTGMRPCADINPEQAIARGAAQRHAIEIAKRDPDGSHKRYLPFYKIGDVTAHDVGCMVLEKNGSAPRHVLAPVIHKNSRIPCRAKHMFALAEPNQTGADIRVLQGVANSDASECLTIGVLKLENLPPEAVIAPRIDLEYVLDPNGMVRVTATDTKSGITTETSVNYKHNGAEPSSGEAQ